MKSKLIATLGFILMLAGCGGTETDADNYVIPPKGGKFDAIPSSYAAGTLKHSSTSFVTKDFAAGQFKAHKWAVMHDSLPYLALEIHTYNTFKPAIWVEYQGPWKETASQQTAPPLGSTWSSTATGAWIIPEVTETGQAKFVFVMRAHKPAEQVTLWITSVGTARDFDQPMDPNATYALKVLPIRRPTSPSEAPGGDRYLCDYWHACRLGLQRDNQMGDPLTPSETGEYALSLVYDKRQQLLFLPSEGYLLTRATLAISSKSSVPVLTGGLFPPSMMTSELVPPSLWKSSCVHDPTWCAFGGTRHTFLLGLTDKDIYWRQGKSTMSWSFADEGMQDPTTKKQRILLKEWKVYGISINNLIDQFGTCWSLLQEYPKGVAVPLKGYKKKVPAPTGSDGCFVAGTLVDTPRGPQTIEALAVGDTVWAYDAAAGQVVERKITQTHVHPAQVVGSLELADGSSITTTPNHPFYDASAGQYRRADQLSRGDHTLRLSPPQRCDAQFRADTPVADDGPAVQTFTRLGQRQQVYNITVAGQHNYFVHGTLVHNKE